MKVGVLALQGDVGEHVAALSELGAHTVEVRVPEDLSGVDALVLPGGESTTIGRLMRLYGLDDAQILWRREKQQQLGDRLPQEFPLVASGTAPAACRKRSSGRCGRGHPSGNAY